MIGDVSSCAEYSHQNYDKVHHNLRELLDSSLPAQIAQLEESSVSLERVAAFCEANYIQSQNKTAALAETKRFALQSLASVAYLAGELSRSLLHALELESLNLSEKNAEIQNISQLIAIQKEKSARREIGKLTANKNVIRQNKITYPNTEEHVPRYQRTPIDFSILDGIGHGRRIAPANDYGTIGTHYGGCGPSGIGGKMLLLNRSGSTASGDSSGAGPCAPGVPPIYDHYARANYGTLSRGSIRSAAIYQDQYRVPHPIPSAIHQQMDYRSTQYPFCEQQQQIEKEDNIYQRRSNNHQLQMIGAPNGGRSDGINDSMLNPNGHYQDYGEYQQQKQEQYGDYQQKQNSQQDNNDQQHLYGVVMRLPQATPQNNYISDHQNSGINTSGAMNKSADFSDDGLPLPPPLILANATGINCKNQQHSRLQQYESLPPPPNHLEGGSVEVSNWIPHQYIEKAVVLYDYDSRNPDELHLYQGALVYVLRKNDDGWFEGVMDGITGLFPGNYVQPIQ